MLVYSLTFLLFRCHVVLVEYFSYFFSLCFIKTTPTPSPGLALFWTGVHSELVFLENSIKPGMFIPVLIRMTAQFTWSFNALNSKCMYCRQVISGLDIFILVCRLSPGCKCHAAMIKGKWHLKPIVSDS